VQNEVNQEESGQDEVDEKKGAASTVWLAICNEEHTDGRARATKDEQRFVYAYVD